MVETKDNNKKGKPKRKVWKLVGLIALGIFLLFTFILIMDILLGRGGLTGNVVSEMNRATLKLECKQQAYDDLEYYTETRPYDDVEYYTESEPYQGTEYYNQVISGSNCDRTSGCTCLHVSWAGLGSCDSCQCTMSRTVTKYQDVQKSRAVTKYQDVQQSRTVTKYKTVCIEIKKWESPNYNENWLNYPELYDERGNLIKGA